MSPNLTPDNDPRASPATPSKWRAVINQGRLDTFSPTRTPSKSKKPQLFMPVKSPDLSRQKLWNKVPIKREAEEEPSEEIVKRVAMSNIYPGEEVKDISQCIIQFEELRHKFSTTVEENKSLQSQLMDANARIAELEEQVKKKDDVVNGLADSIAKKIADNMLQGEKLKLREEQLSDMKGKVQRLQDTKKSSEATILKLEIKWKDIEGKLIRVRRMYKESNAEVEALKLDNEKKDARIEELENAFDAFDGVNTRLRRHIGLSVNRLEEKDKMMAGAENTA